MLPYNYQGFLHDQQELTAKISKTNVTCNFDPHVIYSL